MIKNLRNIKEKKIDNLNINILKIVNEKIKTINEIDNFNNFLYISKVNKIIKNKEKEYNTLLKKEEEKLKENFEIPEINSQSIKEISFKIAKKGLKLNEKIAEEQLKSNEKIIKKQFKLNKKIEKKNLK